MSEQKSASERALELFEQGYNCAQSVFAAFCEKTGIPFDTAVRLPEALGGGCCRLRQTCGAFTGGMLVLSALYGHNDPEHPQSKMDMYVQGQRVGLQFQELFGTFCCAELLDLPAGTVSSPVPSPRTPEYYAQRPCARFVVEMARLVDEEIARTED